MEQELRAKHKAIAAEADALVAKAETDKRVMTDEEVASVKAKLAEMDAISGQLKAIEEQNALKARVRDSVSYSVPETQRTAPMQTPATAAVSFSTNESYEKGDALGALISARARFGQDQTRAEKWAIGQYGSGSRQFQAMQQSVFTAGGATIAENFVSQELIELLRAASAVRRAGARTLPLVNGSATIPKVTGGATAGWLGAEGDNITASDLTTGNVTLVEKKLAALVPVSNDLLKNSNIAVDRLIRDDMVRAAANTEDIAFLKGTGLVGQPKGIYYWVPAAGRGNSAGTSLANVRTDIRTAKNRLGNNNAPNVKRAWFMHGRGINYLGWDLVDGNSNFAFPQLQNGDGANLGGATVYEDNNISITLGAGTGSEVYYVEMSEFFIGDSGSLEVEFFANAAYVDSGGNTRAGISRDESVVRLIRKVDCGMRHDVSAYVLEAVAWGA